MTLLKIIFCILQLSLLSFHATVQGNSFNIALNAGTQEFSNHKNKESSTLSGLAIEYQHMDFLDIKVVARNNDTLFIIPNFETNDLENNYSNMELGLTHNGIAVTLHKYTDFLSGNWTANIQYNQVKGDLSDPALGDVILTGGGIRYENYSGNIFFDINYIESDYSAGTSVKQLDYAAGVMFVPKKAWGQVRQFRVTTSEGTKLNAFEFLFQYWLTTEWLLSIDDLFVSYSFGDRQLFYDPESMVVWNNNDILESYLRFGLSWDLPLRSQLLLVGSKAEYFNHAEEYNYESDMLYVELKKHF